MTAKVHTSTVVNILRAAGYKFRNGRNGNLTGCSVRQFGSNVGIDCCTAQDDMKAIIDLLISRGFEAKEKFAGGAMIEVKAGSSKGVLTGQDLSSGNFWSYNWVTADGDRIIGFGHGWLTVDKGQDGTKHIADTTAIRLG